MLLRLTLLVALAGSPAASAADPPPHAATLAGVVRGPDGVPLTGASVVVNRTSDAPLAGRGLPSTTTGPDGAYRLNIEFTGDRPVVVREVWASRPGFVRVDDRAARPLAPGATATADYALAPGEPLAGILRGATGRAIIAVGGSGFEQIHATDNDGRFALDVPPGGPYAIRALTLDGRPRWEGLAAGSRDLDLKAPAVAVDYGALFDRAWGAVDREYSYFPLKPGVDWAALRDRYRPRAVAAGDHAAFLGVLRELLAHFDDLHVWIEAPGGRIGTAAPRPYPRNWDDRAIDASLEAEGRVDCGFAVVGTTRGDGFGYFRMVDQSRADAAGVAQAVAAIEARAGAPGFVVDLRRANGGDERLARAIARCFCARETVYARSKVRNGPAHDAYGPDRPRSVPAAEHPYTRPVVCLTGPGAVSSGEAFVKMMRARPGTVTVGATTRGASGNPRPLPLPGLDATLYFFRWVDMTPDGRTFEGVGLVPDVPVDAPRAAYDAGDPTLDAGLRILRDRVAAGPPPQ